jgi:FkbM family methyltransferase
MTTSATGTWQLLRDNVDRVMRALLSVRVVDIRQMHAIPERSHLALLLPLLGVDCVFDVGANVGNLTLAAAALVGARGAVWSIEAHPRTYGYLLENVALNARVNVTPLHAAAGDKRAVMSFSDGWLDDQNRVDDGGPLAVKVERLDDLVPARRVQLLKIDVEGYELFVLRGARSLLDGTDCVYFECAERAYGRYGYAVTDVVALLEQKGFTVWERHGTGFSRFVTPHGDHQNLVAIRAASAAVERLDLR